MQALHFGAGNIGRGFIGKLLADAGVKVTFADVNPEIVAAIAERHQYPVKVVGEHAVTEVVRGVEAVNSLDEQALTDLICRADLITTAVGPQILPRIAGSVARGLMARYSANNNQPLNIIACENMVRGTSQFKDHILATLPSEYHQWLNQQVGFVDSAVDRIVPPATVDHADILAVTVETFSEWIVDKTQFTGPIPSIKGMELTDNLMAFVERKLFTLNTGHAITAYLGDYFGKTTIRDAILTPAIRAIVKGAMQESGAVLIKRYHFDAAEHAAYIDKILTRFENPYLHDDTARVGRQPLRKLSPNDRLIKPLLGTLEYQLANQNLLTGIAAALNYRNSDDEQAAELAALIDAIGPEQALMRVSGITDNPDLIKHIAQIYHRMQNRSFS